MATQTSHATCADPATRAHPAPSSPVAPSRGVARFLVGFIRLYQAARFGRVSPCRFTPTCSQYAIEAMDRHGARRGLSLALRRLGRCRPRGPSGYDPVPE